MGLHSYGNLNLVIRLGPHSAQGSQAVRKGKHKDRELLAGRAYERTSEMEGFVIILGWDSTAQARHTHLFTEGGIWFISADAESVALQLEVDGSIVISHIRHVLHTVYLLRYDVSMLHCNERHFDASHATHIARPHT